MSLGSWHGCSACFSGSPALPPPQLFLPYRQTVRPGWETQPPPMQGRAGSSSPGATCHPDAGKVTPRPTTVPVPGYPHPGALTFPLLINRFTSVPAPNVHFSAQSPLFPSKSTFNKGWTRRKPAGKYLVSKCYHLAAVFYKLIRTFTG